MVNKDESRILVVPRNVLFNTKSFQGFVTKDFFNYLDVILHNYSFMIRKEAEVNPDFKQPIGYSVIKYGGKIFAYHRSLTNSYHESRLRGKWSIGIGGHVEDFDDTKSTISYHNPILTSLARELKEEANVDLSSSEVDLFGYINDDSNDVGRVHFGIVYVVKPKFKPEISDNENIEGKLYTIDELKSLDVEFENWSKIVMTSL